MIQVVARLILLRLWGLKPVTKVRGFLLQNSSPSNRLSEAKNGKALSTFSNKIMKTELLIFYEWGYGSLDRDETGLLFEII